MMRQKTVVNKLTGEITTQLVQTSYRTSRPPGSCKFRPQIQRLTNRKFMSSSQKAAFDKGEEIWV